MHSLISFAPSTSNVHRTTALFLCLVALLGSLVALYWWESMFTESHLVGYYCCVSEQDLPALSTLERTLSDFFRTSPGKDLLGVVFVSTNVWIFSTSLLRARDLQWLLPFLFVLCNILYLTVSVALVDLSWSLSNALVGPKTGAYAGYHRTWYGIAAHLALWGTFFLALAMTFVRRRKEPNE